MKNKIFKLTSIVLSLTTCMLIIIQPAFAQTNSQTVYSHTETFENGSYIVDEIQISQPNSSNAVIATTSYSKTATRTYTYYNTLGKKCWSFYLTATFQYDGSTSKATAASSSYTTYLNGWKCSSKTATYSGNTAKGTAAFKYLTKTVNVEIGLKCSTSGTISNVNY